MVTTASVTGTTAVPRSPSKERDSETGLDYFGARYMSSAQGRFTSPDEPLADQDEGNPQSWNLYTYGRNNPLSFTDRDGRKCVTVTVGGDEQQVDDGAGGGCDAAGVDKKGNITPQQFTVTAKRQMFTEIGGTTFEVFDNGRRAPVAERGIQDDIGTVLNVVPAASTAKGVPILGMAIGRFALRGLVAKAAACEAIASMGLPAVQAAAAKSAVGRATASSTVKVTQDGSDVLVQVFREGANGFQVMESRIGVLGNKTVVQKAYDATGKLVHFDPK